MVETRNKRKAKGGKSHHTATYHYDSSPSSVSSLAGDVIYGVLEYLSIRYLRSIASVNKEICGKIDER